MSKRSQSIDPHTIGTKKESSLHKALKLHYSGAGGEAETPADSFICDGRTGKGELIEVQCGSFAPLIKKAEQLTAKNKLRVIHPIIIQKHIELYDTSGRLISRRKSPRKGSAWDLFKVLIYAPFLPLQKNFTIELAIIESVEKRTDDGKGSWRRRHVSIADRTVRAWHYSIVLSKLKDYYQFIPFTKAQRFTAGMLAEKAGIDKAVAGRALYVLTKMGLTERTGKEGNAFVYVRV